MAKFNYYQHYEIAFGQFESNLTLDINRKKTEAVWTSETGAEITFEGTGLKGNSDEVLTAGQITSMKILDAEQDKALLVTDLNVKATKVMDALFEKGPEGLLFFLTKGDDRVIGHGQEDLIFGGGGNDELTGKGGPGGEWLDHTVDMGKTVLIQGGILVALARAGEANNPWLLALIMAFTTVNVLAFFGWLLADLLQRAKGVKVAHARDSGQAPLLRSLLRAPSDYGVFLWTFVLWGTALFWGVYVLLFVACLAILVAALPVWYRQAAAAGGTS